MKENMVDPGAVLAAMRWLEAKQARIEAIVQELREIAAAELRVGEDISQLTAEAIMAVTRELSDLNDEIAALIARFDAVPEAADAD